MYVYVCMWLLPLVAQHTQANDRLAEDLIADMERSFAEKCARLKKLVRELRQTQDVDLDLGGGVGGAVPPPE